MRIVFLLIVYYSSVAYALLNPLFGLLFYFHITIFRPDSLAWGHFAFGRLHLITAFAVLIGYFLHGRQDRRGVGPHQTTNVVLFVLLLIWFVIASIMAQVSVEASFQQTFELTKIFVPCFIFSRIMTRENLDYYTWVTGISFGLLGFWGFLQGVAGNPRLDDLWPGGSNYIAAQLALMTPLMIARAIDARPWASRTIFLASAIAMTLCVIYTESRGGLVGLAIGLGILAMCVKQRLKLVAALVIGFLCISPWISTSYQERVAGIFSEEDKRDDSAKSRVITWNLAFLIWQDNPVVGVGLGNFSPVKDQYDDRIQDINGKLHDLIFNRERMPHGMYQGLLAETGTIGALLFVALILFNVCSPLPRQFIESEGNSSLVLQSRGARAGLIGFCFAAIFGDFQYIEAFYWQIFFVGAIHDQAVSHASSVKLAESSSSDLPSSLPHVAPAA